MSSYDIVAWKEEKVHWQETCCFFYIGKSKSAWSFTSCWWIWKRATTRTNISRMHTQVYFILTQHTDIFVTWQTTALCVSPRYIICCSTELTVLYGLCPHNNCMVKYDTCMFIWWCTSLNLKYAVVLFLIDVDQNRSAEWTEEVWHILRRWLWLPSTLERRQWAEWCGNCWTLSYHCRSGSAVVMSFRGIIFM